MCPLPHTRSRKGEQRLGNGSQNSTGQVSENLEGGSTFLWECTLGLRGPLTPPFPQPDGPRHPCRPAWVSRSHLSDEAVSDFHVIPLSMPEVVTHCSLLPVIAWAWGQITYDQLGTWNMGPQSQSLWVVIAKSQVSSAKRQVL